MKCGYAGSKPFLRATELTVNCDTVNFQDSLPLSTWTVTKGSSVLLHPHVLNDCEKGRRQALIAALDKDGVFLGIETVTSWLQLLECKGKLHFETVLSCLN